MPDAGQTFSGRGNGVTGGGDPRTSYRTSAQYKAELEWERAQEAKAKDEARREAFAKKHEQYNDRRSESTARDREYASRTSSSTARNYGVNTGSGTNFTVGSLNETNSILKNILSIVKDRIPSKGEGSDVEDSSKNRESTFTSIMRAGIVRDTINVVSRIPSARSGLDLLTSGLQIEGSALGGAIGYGFGASTTGAYVGREAAGFYGSALTRSIQAKDDLERATRRYRAISGGEYNVGVPATSYGYDNIQVAEMAGSMAKSGTGSVTRDNLLSTIVFKKIADLDDSIIMTLERQARQTKRHSGSVISNLFGAMESLNIRPGLRSEALAQQASITQGHLMSGGFANTSNIMETMLGLNQVGGMFAIGSATGASYQTALESAMQNPSTPYGQASMYQILRKMNPDADFADLQALQETAGSDPKVLRQFLSSLAITGGASSSIDKLMFQTALNPFGISATGSNELYKGFMSGNMDVSDETLRSYTLQNSSMSQASALTTRQERETAEATNAFTVSFKVGIDTVASQWKDRMIEANKAIYEDILNRISGNDKVAGLSRSEFEKEWKSLQARDKKTN
jgi:hypothetical protein